MSLEEIIIPEGFEVGHASDHEAGTGCTVIMCREGGLASVDVRGGGPATRETDISRPENPRDEIHAIVFSGGSAFGLDACGGVMEYLEQQKIGYSIAGAHVPIVSGCSIFDLPFGGSSLVRPDQAMGIKACESASSQVPQRGNVGVGTGATVGKILGDRLSCKSGFGMGTVQKGDIIVTALAVVNAFGYVFNPVTNQCLAGTRNPLCPNQILDLNITREIHGDSYFKDKAKAPLSSAAQEISQHLVPDDFIYAGPDGSFCSNTTLGCVLTNAKLTKAEMYKTAVITHDAYARCIRPVHTVKDGDAIYTYSTCKVEAPQIIIAIMAQQAMEMAIVDAVQQAQDAGGLPASSSLEL